MKSPGSVKRKAPPPPLKTKPLLKPKPTVTSKPNILDLKKKNPLLNELESALSKQKKLAIEDSSKLKKDFSEDVPLISDKTFSLTEVSSLKNNKNDVPKRPEDFNDTLDFTLSDEGFDVSPCESGLNLSLGDIGALNAVDNLDDYDDISEVKFSDDDDDIDDFLNNLSVVPPPPPDMSCDITNDDDPLSFGTDDYTDIPPPNMDSEIGFLLTPPPPPPDDESLKLSSSEEGSVISQPSAFNENDKIFDNTLDVGRSQSSLGKHSDLNVTSKTLPTINITNSNESDNDTTLYNFTSSQKSMTSSIKTPKPRFNGPEKPKICLTELKSKLDTDFVREDIYAKISVSGTLHKDIDAKSSVSGTSDDTITSDVKLNTSLRSELRSSSSMAYRHEKYTPEQRPLSSMSSREASRNDRPISRLSLNSKKLSKVESACRKPKVDFDSGHSTGRSQDISDSDAKHSTENVKTHLKSNLSRSDSINSEKKSHRKNSTASKVSHTWSSGSASSVEDSYIEQTSKMNLREKFLQHMKTFDSDIEENGWNDEIRNDLDGDEIEISACNSEDEMRLNNLDVEEWTYTDVGDWLDLIGIPYLKNVFRRKRIDGKALLNMDMSLLDAMNIEDKEDKEFIISEIYALQNNTIDGELEVSMLDALDKTYGEERAKMLSLISALQDTPSDAYMNNSYISSPTSPVVSPPQSPGIVIEHMNGESISQLSKSNDFAIVNKTEIKNQIDKENMMKLLAANVYDPDNDEDNTAKETGDRNSTPASPDIEKLKKKPKRKGFFASLRRKRNKGNKSAIMDTTIYALSQENPRGMVKIHWTPQNSANETVIKLLISMNTTSQEVCVMCLDYLALTEDAKCFFIVISRKDRKDLGQINDFQTLYNPVDGILKDELMVENIDLTPTECPLMFQCKWTDMETYQFELKQKIHKYIIVNNEDKSQEEMVTIKLGVSAKTTAKDVLPILLKKLNEKADKKYFHLVQNDNSDPIGENTVLTELPLQGYKFHVFKLINTASLQQKTGLSHTEIKKMETKVSLLENQIERLTNQIEEYKRQVTKLKENEKDIVIKLEDTKRDNKHKADEIRRLQIDLKTQDHNSVYRAQTPSTVERELKLENTRLQTETKHQQLQLEQNALNLKNLKNSQNQLKDDKEKLMRDLNKMEAIHEDLRETYNELQTKQSSLSHSENTEQIKKLYAENKELLRKNRSLEDKLCEMEAKISQNQYDQEVDSVEFIELRNKVETLEHSLLEKDSKILEYEYKVQKKDRDLREREDQLEDEQRKWKKVAEAKDSAERKLEDALSKLDVTKSQLNDRDKQIQSLRNQMAKQDRKLTKQKTLQENELNVKGEQMQLLKQQHENEIQALETQLDSMQKMVVEKEVTRKQFEFDFSKQNEDLKLALKDMERKVTAKDVIIDRLENKLAKVDLNITSKLQTQVDTLKTREEKISQLEIEITRLESEHASKLRELSSTVRTKESFISKLEGRMKKLEINNRESSRKFERYIGEKDRLLMQVNDDRDKESKELKNRVRQVEDELTNKEKQIRDVQRKASEMKNSLESRLKKRDKEYKQQKYLLEKLLEIVNNKAPSILRHLENSLDDDRIVSPRHNKSQNSSKHTDEWC